MMFLAKFSREVQYVDILVVFHASERLRSESFLSEEIEPGAAHPLVHERVRAPVSSKTCFQSFLENFVEFRLQRVYVSNTWRARRHPFSLFFLELEEIEIESAVAISFSTLKSFFRNREQRKPRGKRQRFLRAGEHYVNTERVHVDLHRGE